MILAPVVSRSAAAPVPLGLPGLPVQGTSDEALAQIGRQLFSDLRLSADGTISCASCHKPEQYFTDRRARAIGIAGQSGTRNTPSLLNVVYSTTLFWDGRETTLESQARRPLMNPREHGLDSESAILDRVNTIPGYRKLFARQLGRGRVTIDDVMAAIASYERTLLSGNSSFDRFLYGGDQHAMSKSASRGLILFRDRAHCDTCHTIGPESALLTDNQFHSAPLGLSTAANTALIELTQRVVDLRQREELNEINRLVGREDDFAALGRFVVTLNPNDIGLFKTPSLRNVALTGPYFHDGRIETLRGAVDVELYSRGDAVRYPIVMTEQEKTDLIEFLGALSSPLTP
jgi:cytochrome c peroxidase